MVELAPIGSVDSGLLKNICEEIKNVFHNCRISDKSFAVPQRAYSPSRNQFDSLPLLEALMEYSHSKGIDKLLGITSVDIYTENLNFIFGHAYVGGRACLVSIHRLDPKYYGKPSDNSLLLERTVKEAIHELGHSFGLGHCDDRRCVMVFSNNISEVDAKSKKFCHRCAKTLGVSKNDIHKKL